MTGNTKNLMNNLYLAVFHKNKEALHTFFTLLIGITVFMLGVGTGTVVLLFGDYINLWLAFAITGCFYLWLLFKRD